MNVPDPLRFVFSGYSIWLEVDQTNNDLDTVIETASLELNVLPIPTPHITVLYGVCQDWDEVQVQQLFQEVVFQTLFDDEYGSTINNVNTNNSLWPLLRYKGCRSDTEYLGVNGGQMDMSWIELSFATSKEHETLIHSFYTAFQNATTTTGLWNYETTNTLLPSSSSSSSSRPPWSPHISIAYDNPNSTFTSQEYLKSLFNRYPTLEIDRAVTGISLWKTEGTIGHWKCLQRVDLTSKEESIAQ